MSSPDFSAKRIRQLEFYTVATVVLFIAAFILVGVFSGVSEIWDAVKQLSWPLLLAMWAMSFINLLFRGGRWPFFAKRLELNIPLKRLGLYYMGGVSLTTTPGKVGTAIRLWFIKRCHGYAFARTMPMMFMDQFVDILAISLLTGVGAMFFGGKWIAVLLCGGIIFGIGLLVVYPALLTFFIKLGYRLIGYRLPRLFAAINRSLKLTRKLFSPRVLSITVVFSAIAWLAESFAFWMLLQALDQTQVSFLAAMFIFLFATMIGGLSMLPGGLGGTDATIFGLLLLLDVPTPIATVATAGIRLTTLWFTVAFSLFFLGPCLRLARKR